MLRRNLFLMILVVTLLLGSGTAALAEEPANMQEVRGQVTAVSLAERTISVRTSNVGPVTIHTNEQTQFVIPGVPNPGLDDVQVGDQVVATGQWRARSQFLARVVAVHRPERRPIEVAGEVTAIDFAQATFMLRTRSGETKTIVTNGSTRFIIPGVPEPGLDDVRVGDQALVTGWLDPANPSRITALSVVIHRPQPRPIEVAGTVREINLAGGTFTLVTRSGDTKIISTTAETRFIIPGVPEPGLDDVQVGDRAVVTGWVHPRDPNRVIARIVVIQRPRPQPVKVAGRVTAIDLAEGTFTLEIRSTVTRTITTTAETRFIIPDVPEPGLDDVRVGDQALVTGIPNPRDPRGIFAQIVAIHRPRPRPGRVSGRVTAVDTTAGTLTVQTEEGIKTVKTDERTRLCVPGVENPTLADFLDQRIVALGFWNEDGSLQARVVALPDCEIENTSITE